MPNNDKLSAEHVQKCSTMTYIYSGYSIGGFDAPGEVPFTFMTVNPQAFIEQLKTYSFSLYAVTQNVYV